MVNFIIVGGFLGAGKTSIISLWVKYMAENGKKPGVIVNDLSNALVDKQWFDLLGVASESIWGGCVCNTVKKLQNSVLSLESKGIDTVFLEPVGSHLNLSQQLLPSILSSCPNVRLKPVVILIDAQRLLLALHRKKEYIMEFIELQLLSADLLLINKIDFDKQLGFTGNNTLHQ